MLSENRDKVDAAARADVERGIEESKKILDDNKEAKDAAVFKHPFESLQKASYKMAAQMYKTSAPPADGAGEAGPGASAASATQEQKDVIDAEFEEH